MIRFFVLVFAFFISSCGGSFPSHGFFRIGIDRDWYPLDFGIETAYVNGFTENLLVEMSSYSGIYFELIDANWDSLQKGLKTGQYEALLTSEPSTEISLAKYSFSENFLDLGPVIIVSYGSKKKTLDDFSGRLLGILNNDPVVRVIEKHPEILIRIYPSIPKLLDALAKGEIEGAVLDQIPAAQYVGDLYAGVLKIVGKPLTNKGLHLMGSQKAVDAFDKSLKALRKNKTLEKLQKKWSLNSDFK